MSKLREAAAAAVKAYEDGEYIHKFFFRDLRDALAEPESDARPENKPWVVDAIESGRGAVSTADGREVTGWIDLEDAFLIAAAPELLEALHDMLAEWVYIRETYGDLYGVGWDRAQDKANAAIAKARL
jgi:hypothetical protein